MSNEQDDFLDRYDPGITKPCVEKLTNGCEKCLVKDSCSEYEYICPVCNNNPCTCNK